MRTRFARVALVLVLFACLLVVPATALAGPGGKIASTVFASFWGKILLGLLVIVFLPVVIYVLIREHLAVKRTHADLRKLAALSPSFDWLRLKERVAECFHQVHQGWRREDMQRAADWMTGWYWQNQQIAHLDRWHEAGLVNHCTVKSVGSIKPLFVAYRNERGTHDGSRVVVSITARMEDYLAERVTGKIVEGKKGFDDHETIWTLLLEDGRWRVANIEEASLSLAYARLLNEMPDPETSVKPSRAAS